MAARVGSSPGKQGGVRPPARGTRCRNSHDPWCPALGAPPPRIAALRSDDYPEARIYCRLLIKSRECCHRAVIQGLSIPWRRLRVDKYRPILCSVTRRGARTKRRQNVQSRLVLPQPCAQSGVRHIRKEQGCRRACKPDLVSAEPPRLGSGSTRDPFAAKKIIPLLCMGVN
jgi:hypothetical protein